ncbi:MULTISPECIES: hypothetical protein [unclassified Mesorhizobium]|uniref:hypothetical protein n=1 Tax=unclassified Mesorhizobium TaxID=325217 RepID=UPI001AC84014|nr:MULTISPECIES: hypothetical protein [unclassified Mesorhizobium]MBN9255827.1 hypothetical protein [Mesorhizobium sp.]
MSRFIPFRDMSAAQVVQCGYDAMAIISLCSRVAGDLSSHDNAKKLGGDIAIALDLAGELLGIVHDTVEMHEGAG